MYSEEQYWADKSNMDANVNTQQIDLLLAQQAPFMLLKPKVFLDGNKWCAMYGSNLMEGVTGWGDSPDEAMIDFNKEWNKKV